MNYAALRSVGNAEGMLLTLMPKAGLVRMLSRRHAFCLSVLINFLPKWNEVQRRYSFHMVLISWGFCAPNVAPRIGPFLYVTGFALNGINGAP